MLTLALLLVAAAAGLLTVSPWVNTWHVAAALGLGAVILSAVKARAGDQAPEGWTWPHSVALILALAVGLWFRTRYFHTVPAGYLGEVLAFVNFADELREKGFPYKPYAWYAHTLFSYVIAATGLLVPDPIEAMRLAQLFISLATLGAIAWCAWVLFGRTAACATTALVAISWWHLWATRNGYHQFLTPLFQALVLGGLVRGLRDQRPRALWLAAAALVVGLHAYWALYLLPPFVVLALAVFAWWWPSQWRRMRSTVGTCAVVTVVASIPAILDVSSEPEGFAYVFGGLQPVRVGASTLSQKLATNAAFLRRAFFPEFASAAVPPVVLDPVVRTSLLIGLGTALWAARNSFAALATVGLLGLNVAALLAAISNEFYIIAVFVPVYVLAGLGVARFYKEAQRTGALLAWPVLALLVGIWVSAAVQSERRFFGPWAVNMFRSPQHPQGVAFLLVPHWKACVQAATCMVPMSEPGRDFEVEALSLGWKLRAYAWLHQVRRVESNTALFTPMQVVPGRPVEIFLPDSVHARERLLRIWQEHYPEAVVEAVPPPPPWDELTPRTLAWRVRIPPAALERMFVDPMQSGRIKVLFRAPTSGRYEFRKLVPSHVPVRVDDEIDAVGPVFLEAGYHWLELVVDGVGWSGWQVRFAGLDWTALDHHLVRGDQVKNARHLRPFLGAAAKPGRYSWKLVDRWSLPGGVWDLSLCPDGSAVAWMGGKLYRLASSADAATPLADEAVPDPALRCSTEGIDIVGRDGRWLRWSPEGVREMAVLGCPVAAVAPTGGPLVALCADSRVWQQGADEMQLRDRFDQPLRQPRSITICGGDFYVTDAAVGELLHYARNGVLLDTKVMPNSWWESELACDDEDNLYVLLWREGRVTYSRDGSLLLHPEFLRPSIFTRDQQWFHGFSFRRFAIQGDRAVWTRDAELELLERVRSEPEAIQGDSAASDG